MHSVIIFYKPVATDLASCNYPRMNSFRDIIAAWPSRQDMADDLGQPIAAINMWHHRDSIPPPYWYMMVAAAKERKIRRVTTDNIVRMVSIPRREN